MGSIWGRIDPGWRILARRVWQQLLQHDVFGQAAKLSFYFFLALFPFLIFLSALLGYFAQDASLRNHLLAYAGRVLPHSAFTLVHTTLEEITSGAGKGKLSFGILAALIAASSGVVAISEGINTAYEIRDQRSWWHIRLLALALTAALGFFTLASLVLALYGAALGEWVWGRFGLESMWTVLWEIGRWFLAGFLILLGLDMLYRFAPDLKRAHWRWLRPGSVIALCLWLAASFGFRLYLKFFDTFPTTYGSLGAVIVLLLWLYIGGIAILTGAEVDSEIENAAALAGQPDARLAGERVPGERKSRAAGGGPPNRPQ